MEPNILMTRNRQIKKNRPYLSNEKVCDVFRNGNLMEIGFLSLCCRRDRCGTCIMCDYGAADGTRSVQEYLREMEHVLEKADGEIDILLLCTNGSFLDRDQISPELFRSVLARAAQTRASLVEIEAHYQDVTREKLQQIKKLLSGKQVAIEMGLETVNPLYQSYIIMKGIQMTEYERTVSLIQSFDFSTEVNVMIGLPFLSAKEQFEDAAKTIQWAFNHGCRPVLFPMNIKPYTLLMDMYRSGHYSPISQWMLPLLLDTLPQWQLQDITVAWYGNREEVYPSTHERVVFPHACPACVEAIRHFYQQFLAVQNGGERKDLLARLLSKKRSCSCLDEAKQEISTTPSICFNHRYAEYISYIKTNDLGRAMV